MENNTVSVIIPCYRAETTIEMSIRSVLEQTVTDLEILAVDDGSPDRTGEVLEQLAKEDDRIRVIRKENGGVSSARNAGMDQARGKWLFFLDGDDHLEPFALETLLSEAEKAPDAEIICGAYAIRHQDSGEVEIHACAEGNKTVIYESLIRGDSALNSMCARLYLNRLIRDNHLRAPEGVKVGEDVLFNLDAFCAASCWQMVPKVIYWYELGGDSAMMRARQERFASSRQMIDGILDFTRENGLETSLFRAVIDVYVRTLRADYGRLSAAFRLRRADVRDMTRGVNHAQLPRKQQLYYHALRFWPALSGFLP